MSLSSWAEEIARIYYCKRSFLFDLLLVKNKGLDLNCDGPV